MTKLASWSRWLARLAATLMAALFITFLVGEGTPDLREISDQEIAGFAAVFLMIAGTLVSWRWDFIGGLMLGGGFLAFCAIEGGWPPLPFLLFGGAGALLLLASLLGLLARRSARAAPPAGAPAG